MPGARRGSGLGMQPPEPSRETDRRGLPQTHLPATPAPSNGKTSAEPRPLTPVRQPLAIFSFPLTGHEQQILEANLREAENCHGEGSDRLVRRENTLQS